MVIGWLNSQSLCYNTDAVQQTIKERCLYVRSLTETWRGASDDVCLHLISHCGWICARRRCTYVRCRHHLPSTLQVFAAVCRTMEVICGRLITKNRLVVLMSSLALNDRRRCFSTSCIAALLKTLVVCNRPVVVMVATSTCGYKSQ